MFSKDRMAILPPKNKKMPPREVPKPQGAPPEHSEPQVKCQEQTCERLRRLGHP